MTEKEIRHEAMILGRIARAHFLKGHTPQEAEAEICAKLIEIVKKAVSGAHVGSTPRTTVFAVEKGANE